MSDYLRRYRLPTINPAIGPTNLLTILSKGSDLRRIKQKRPVLTFCSMDLAPPAPFMGPGESAC